MIGVLWWGFFFFPSLQVRVSVSKEFLECVDKKVTKQRPLWRVNAANVDTSHDSALILNDHSLFSQGNHFHQKSDNLRESSLC